ncbi:MAG: tRNA (cytidine(34)-2'-O)-methyltransferase [Erysipelotrichaceae bacterium]|nr:tRNA (cytidine(34)-2'-O)-methyltransferase [Erysipelotrichaceae bacterium]
MIHIVLFEPEIPQNTGNIMRSCVAFHAQLHLIKPLGFKLDESRLRRSGLDYIQDLTYTVYENFEEFKIKNNNPILYFVTRYGHKPPSSFDFKTDDDIYLMFGKESTGIPKEILQTDLQRCMRLPMVKSARSLNLSNCVAICIYEVLRQNEYYNLSFNEYIKGAHWIEN